MNSIEFQIKLPFYLQVKTKKHRIPYTEIYGEKISQFLSSEIEISFLDDIHPYVDGTPLFRPYPCTKIAIRIELPFSPSDEDVNFFACINCLEIVNWIIQAYHASTLIFKNAGYITPIGLSEILLNAAIHINGKDFRDRKPLPSLSNLPLPSDQEKDFEDYLRGKKIPLSRLHMTNALLLLEQGHYPLAALQAIMAIEIHLTNSVTTKLIQKNKTNKFVYEYQEKTSLHRKLIFNSTDDRSIKKYWSHISDLNANLQLIDSELRELRNKIVHAGYIPNRNETQKATKISRWFVKSIK